MSTAKHFATAAEDRIALGRKLAYGVGAFVNNLLAGAIGGMMIVLNLGLGMNPALVGLLGALPRLADALTDPLMGYVSDRTRSRWGRRRPYVFAGALAAGLIYALLWQLPRGQSESFYFWFFLSDVELGGAQTEQAIFLMRLFDTIIPIIASALAIWAIAAYPLTEQRAHEIREELERRRGLRSLPSETRDPLG